MAGLYLHIPYCKSKCRYCDFVSFADCESMGEYCAALLKEMRLDAAALPKQAYDTVFSAAARRPFCLLERWQC